MRSNRSICVPLERIRPYSRSVPEDFAGKYFVSRPLPDFLRIPFYRSELKLSVPNRAQWSLNVRNYIAIPES